MLRILGLGQIKGRINRFKSKTIQSNPVSLRLRPIFEHKNAKNILGLPLLALTVFSGALSSPLLTAMGFIPTEAKAFYQPYETLQTQIETTPAIAYPLIAARGVSQGYHVLHPGVDIRAPRGSEITPVAGGVVKLIARERFGYGNRVEIDHQDGHESLYAHMDKILVGEGQKVTVDTVIGTVGMTGRTTGPHLHLEVRNDGRTINPLTYLSRRNH